MSRHGKKHPNRIDARRAPARLPDAQLPAGQIHPRRPQYFLRRVRAPHWELRVDVSPERRVTQIGFGSALLCASTKAVGRRIDLSSEELDHGALAVTGVLPGRAARYCGIE
jgi:hypothetical protein